MKWLILAGALVIGTILTGHIRQLALRRQILDIPNERSSHTRPTPRSGGIGFVVTFLVGTAILYLSGAVSMNLFAALAIGGGLIASVGYVDDMRDLSPYSRLVLQGIAAIIGAVLFHGLPRVDLGFVVIELGLLGYPLAIVGLIWLVNLYNFMDGIDGIAASEAITVTGVTAIILSSLSSDLAWVCGLLAVSCLAFLPWNWSPARIFMGDVGSGFLGYALGILALASGQQSPTLLWVWLILLGVFIVDTLLTLINRIRRGEKWQEAHRTHAYQQAVTRWKSHARVTTAVIMINLLWLTPCALVVWWQPQLALPMLFIAFVPLVVLARYLKAGTAPQPSKQPDQTNVTGQPV